MKKKVFSIIMVMVFCSSCWSVSIKQRPWEKSDLILAGASTVASVWNIYEAEKMLDAGFTETMPHYFSDTPSDEGLVITMGLTQIGTLLLGHFAPVIEIRDGKGEIVGDFELRKPLLGAKIGANTALAIGDRELRKSR